ncbi:mitotic-spindle organizing protein 1-like [Physella acuta]|uniref:mitotic-spindle organizing protein 1-like n=1 Tax=Physella acuta TaxID=109671 RepID=UPI0027DE4345|nr:mitotic-spindle organizing protein 1-like [Physella acuta]XP_059164281.1 mitotic-spindle organizing protein 1-like [Physella acuta]XP_059164282.1 mitotic-spindle organizing protein 1-like [Physella acuta]XP_059164284.1 mitotic-spindle organizing protein 1-like [Physella acuta]XP_059164285.1 mitotic-spindle organizing protein 1-like [Physella acuta]XP_059164286.1 mitotic-spindle organizing protein 1-like [Physella acuta]XP_059164287.1 mitotic-spindle organizing protein 1-like [Physella acut
MASNQKQKSPAASETMDILMEMSRLLNTGLDEETMAVCLRLCENGINPEALAEVIKELRRESANVKANESGNTT